MENQETQRQEQTSKFDGISDALDIETDIMPIEKPAVEKLSLIHI